MIQQRSAAAAGTAEDCGNRKFYGKYRGTVYNNIDPNGMGRVQVIVPAVAPTPLLHWATLCTPISGLQNGMYAVPPIGSGVWIEFEAGDTDYPICSGGFWGSSAEVPRLGKNAQKPLINSVALQTTTQNGITISDFPTGDSGGVQITTIFGAKISITLGQITISNGPGMASIEMRGPTISINAPGGVSINNGALSVI